MLRPGPLIDVPQPNPALNRDAVKPRAMLLHHARRAATRLLCSPAYMRRCALKQFLAVYLGSPEAIGSWNELPESERNARTAQGVCAWHAWVDQYRDQIVIDGGPLGRTKSISRSGIADIRNAMTAFTLVRAESHAAAATLFEGHPHFSIFPGESVEVMECLPVPAGMAQP